MKELINKGTRKELMKEGRKEVVHLPENCAASKTDPTCIIRAKSPCASTNLLKKKCSFQNFYVSG